MPQKREATSVHGHAGAFIQIPKKLRLDWMDLMAFDVLLSPTAFKVGCLIGAHLNNKTGTTFISEERIRVLAIGKIEGHKDSTSPN